MTPAQKLAQAKPKRKRRRDAKTASKAKARVLVCSLRDVRTELRLSLKDVSEATKISLGHLYEVEQGSEIGMTLALRLAEFYGKPIESLWSLKKNGETIAGAADPGPRRKKADSRGR